MSKSNRKEIAKRLAEQIAVTTDPKQLAELTREYNKLTRLRKAKRKPHKPEATPSNQKSSILTRVTGSGVDNLSDGEKVLHHLVVQVEKKQKSVGRALTEAERKAAIADEINSLLPEERAAYDSIKGA